MNGPTTNLTTACLDPGFSLQSFDDLHRCFREYGHLDSGVYKVPVDSTLGKVVQPCIRQYCESPHPDVGGCAGTKWDYMPFLAVGADSVKESWFAATECSGINDVVDQDVGGIGVVISYLMAIGIVLYIWIVMTMLRCIPPVAWSVNHAYHKILGWMQPVHNRPWTKQRPDQVRARLQGKFSHHVFVLKSTMAQFQEAQCFFMLAVQVTILAAFGGRGIGVLESNNMAQLGNNLRVSQSVAVMGIFPNILALWVLHTTDMVSWYILLWSTMTLAISNAALYVSFQTPRPDQVSSPIDAAHLDQCGGNQPPLIYCDALKASTSMFDGEAYLVINYICLIYYAYILFVKAATSLRQRLDGRQWPATLIDRIQGVHGRLWARVISRLMSVGTELLFACLLLAYTVSLATTNYYSLNLESSSWSFGQVIALTAWAPVCFRYIYWAVFGTDSYSAIHIPKPFQILRVTTDANGGVLPEGDREQFFIHLASRSDLGLVQHCSTMTDIKVQASDREVDL